VTILADAATGHNRPVTRRRVESLAVSCTCIPDAPGYERIAIACRYSDAIATDAPGATSFSSASETRSAYRR
jgi:hypothetical protein